jgi:hypothetical protein
VLGDLLLEAEGAGIDGGRAGLGVSTITLPFDKT